MAAGGVSGAIGSGRGEVAKYWVYPAIEESTMVFIANMDFWNSLSKNDQLLIERIIQYHTQYFSNLYNWNTASDLEEVGEALGVELQLWDANDWQQWADAVKATQPQHPDDSDWVEAVRLLDEYRQRG